MTHIEIRTNDEVSIDGKVVGWASTYNQASSKNRDKFPRLENEAASNKFVFWPMTPNRIRADHIIVDDRLDDRNGGWNVAELTLAIEKAAP